MKKDQENSGNKKPLSVLSEPEKKRLLTLSITALGVVFGDIGTSPLYAIRECFYGDFGIAVTPANVLGVLSLIFWSLILVVSIKYLTFILRADNHGEGGIIALTSLIRPRGLMKMEGKWILVAVGVFGACLLYGDGMITPAISVMSAIEGMGVITHQLDPYIIPVTVIILAGLFLLQPRGTGSVGALFGPVIFVWFCTLGVLGFFQVIKNPVICRALLPWHGLDFLLRNHVHGFLVLGAVFLVVTGAEALYADMGHFGRRPIRLVWFVLVLPALLLNYFGQGAVLLTNPKAAIDPFYAIVPSWGMIPMVFLATAATIIASQAVISGAFSLTRQAVQLGYLPRIKIVHTSAKQIGQIYVPLVNWVLMVSTIGLAVGFHSSSKLAAAYGVAVTSTMLISTILFFVVAKEKWKWSSIGIFIFLIFFLVIDTSFFLANISKIFHGAWFPLVIGAVVFTIMITWKQGRELLWSRLRRRTLSLDKFLKSIALDPPLRVDGQAVFLTGNPDVVPVALMHNLKHNKVMHNQIAFLNFRTREIPRVPNNEKVEVEKLGSGFYRVVAWYGFMEEPKIKNIFSLAREKGLDFDPEKVSYFLGREKLSISKEPGMWRWRIKLFSFMSRNAMEAADFFNLPGSKIVELGVTLEI
jgi:KUP system potassium uptake protein